MKHMALLYYRIVIVFKVERGTAVANVSQTRYASEVNSLHTCKKIYYAQDNVIAMR